MICSGPGSYSNKPLLYKILLLILIGDLGYESIEKGRGDILSC